MPKQSDIKKALESITGQELPEEAVQLFDLYSNVATYDRTDKPGEYFLTEKSLIANLPNRCGGVNLLDVSAWWLTGNDGKTRFRLSNFTCEQLSHFIYPINVVVTPVASKPCFATVISSLVKDNNTNKVIDVEIEVSTWDANGAPAPKVAFNWRCRVPFHTILL